jgi:hypothetical protein
VPINVFSTGPLVRIQWFDRQGLIESRDFNLTEDLPRFLLLLLILQRLDGTRSGSFKDCSESGFHTRGSIATATFKDERTTEERTFVFYPEHDKMNRVDRKFTGRAMFVFGAREGPVPSEPPGRDVDKIRKGNGHVLKVCWLEDDHPGEVDVIKKAREYGEGIDLIENHIPDMVCYMDPTWISSSTKIIRKFMGLATKGSRTLCVIVFRRLRPINMLKEKEMLTAYLQCFFCGFLTINSKRTTEGLISTGHSLLWKKGIRHCNIGVKDLMWDDRRQVGVLNGLGFAMLADEKDTGGRNFQGAYAFLALDLIERSEDEETRRFYRHDAESLAWSLIYLSFTTVKGEDGENHTKEPNPLKDWFDPAKDSYLAKFSFNSLLHHHRQWSPTPHDAYPNAKELASRLTAYWFNRFIRQRNPGLGTDRSDEEAEPLYTEPDDERVFTELLAIHQDVLASKEELRAVYEDLREMTRKYRQVDRSG